MIMDTTRRSPAPSRLATAAIISVALVLLGIVAGCGSNGEVESTPVTVDPVTVDDRGLPDGRDLTTLPWPEVGPGWTLAAYDPSDFQAARTGSLYLVAPDGRRWAVATVELGERDTLGIEDWLPATSQAIVARRHVTGMDENPEPGGLDLVDLETGEGRELTAIGDGQVNIATLSRPTGRVVVFADGVGGPLQRRSQDFELLSTLANEAFDWAHSPDGALVAIGTLPSTGPSRLSIVANDTGDELSELPIPPAYRFCQPVGWLDPDTLGAECGNTGVVQASVLWLYPTDGSAPRQLLTADAAAVTGAARQPDGTLLLATTDEELWTAGDDGTKLAGLPGDAALIGASATGAVVLADGELLLVQSTDGATIPLLPRQSGAPGVVSAVTLLADDFTAERPAGGNGDPTTDGATGTPAPPAPEAGTLLEIVGVRFDDVLNFRVDPEPSADIVTTGHPDVLERQEDAVIVATGEATTSGSSIWWKVTVDGQEGWANSRFLGILGEASDDAPELIGLEAADEDELADVVAQARPPGDATGVAVAVTGQDAISASLTIDVLGNFGDGVKGERFDMEAYFIKATDPEATPQVTGFRIMFVTRTPICVIGVDDTGGCL
jgi:hypothetical protein